MIGQTTLSPSAPRGGMAGRRGTDTGSRRNSCLANAQRRRERRRRPQRPRVSPRRRAARPGRQTRADHCPRAARGQVGSVAKLSDDLANGPAQRDIEIGSDPGSSCPGVQITNLGDRDEIVIEIPVGAPRTILRLEARDHIAMTPGPPFLLPRIAGRSESQWKPVGRSGPEKFRLHSGFRQHTLFRSARKRRFAPTENHQTN